MEIVLSHQEIQDLAQQITAGFEFNQELDTLKRDSDQLREEFIDQAKSAVAKQISISAEGIPQEVIDSIVERSQNDESDERLGELFATKEKLKELGIEDTAAVDDKINETLLEIRESKLSAEEELALKAIAVNNLSQFVMFKGGGEQVEFTQVAKMEAKEIQDLPEMIITINDPDTDPTISIGRRKIKLSGTNAEGYRDYSTERFAALAALSELSPGESLTIDELKEKMAKLSGSEESEQYTKESMVHVRRFLMKLRYRNQQIFFHNGLRGLASRYGVNPELNFDITLDIETDEEVIDIVNKLSTSGSTPEAEETENLKSDEQPPSQLTPAPAEPLPEAKIIPLDKTVESIDEEQAPEVHATPEMLPDPVELHALLIKLRGVANREVLDRINPEKAPMILNFLHTAEEMLAYIEEDYSEQDRIIAETEQVRLEVVNKFIKIVEDDDLLNKFLNMDEDMLESIYGKTISKNLHSIIESALDMSDDEKQLLVAMAKAKEGIRIEVDSGSFSRGQRIIDTETKSIVFIPGSLLVDYGNKGIDLTANTEEPLDTNEVKAAEADQTTEFKRNAGHEATTEENASRQQVEEKPTPRDPLTEKTNRAVGEIINQLQEMGAEPGASTQVPMLLEKFSLRSSDIGAAKSAGVVRSQGSRGQGLDYIDAVGLILFKDSNFSKEFGNRRTKKKILKAVKAAIQKSQEASEKRSA